MNVKSSDRDRLIVLIRRAVDYASVLDNASDGVQLRRAFIARKTDLLISPAEGYDKEGYCPCKKCRSQNF